MEELHIDTDRLLDLGATKRPCGDCPFREAATPGWLGPYGSATDLHREVMSEQPFACHETIDAALNNGEDERPERLRICAGSLGYMKACAKRPRHPRMAALVEGADATGILRLRDFIEHHDLNNL